MATAYVYFTKPVNGDTVTALTMGARTLVGERDPQGARLWDHLFIEIASGGGDVVAAFSAYNTLSNINAQISTHNIGAVDSSALVIFMAGTKRTASPCSAFFFHQLAWTFSSQGSLNNTTISDASKWLGTYEGLMSDLIADRSNLSKDDVLKLMRDGTSISPKKALEMGLIEAIEDSKPPDTARSWQV